MKRHIEAVINSALSLRNKQGIRTGFELLDQLTGGLRKGDLIMIGGRPESGKSTILGDIAYRTIAEERKCCLFFSLERSAEMALLSGLLHIPKKDVSSGLNSLLFQGNARRQPVSERLAGLFGGALLWMEDTSVMTVSELVSVSRRFQKRQPIDLIVIDCLQSIAMFRHGSPEKKEDILVQLKQLALELDCPVLVSSQLSRKPELRKDHVPELTDFADFSIPRIADEVLLLYRDYRYQDKPEQDNRTMLFLAKHPLLTSSSVGFHLEYRDYLGLREKVFEKTPNAADPVL